jgi:hypothetical protein
MASLRRWLRNRAIRRKNGFPSIELDYPAWPRSRPWAEAPGLSAIRHRLDASQQGADELLAGLAELSPVLEDVPAEPDPARPWQPAWHNDWFPPIDALLLCTLLRDMAPATYLEIGSGHSTRFARLIIQRLGLPTRIVSIDPAPRAEIDALCDRVIRSGLQDLEPGEFPALNAGDLLFFDGSHRTYPNSDVTVFFTEMLPRLPADCVWGLHDIFLPDDYPDAWRARFYSEQYMLVAYLLGGGGHDRLLAAAHDLAKRGKTRQTAFGDIGDGGSIWFRRDG